MKSYFNPNAEQIRSNDLVADAVSLIREHAIRAQENDGWFRLSLCGGGTPQPVYRGLAETSGIDWERVLITFGDERCVPPDDTQSNFRMANETLLKSVSIPATQVLRMEGELDPGEAAVRYEAALRTSFPGDATPVHDLILLGMGDDGHTASLFPDTTALDVTDRLVVENYVSKFDQYRLTVTYPLINAARHVVFMVSGQAKRDLCDKIFSGATEYPAARVNPESQSLPWIIG